MRKKHYPWWGYVKAIVSAYSGLENEKLSGVALKEYNAVRSAVEATEYISNGASRMQVIKLVHFDGTHTLEGAALTIPCDRATAARWQRSFFEQVARNRGLLD